ncbi:hypothetical protein [Jejuia pallidilutea]|nr:hypothetical protein [Jejuia pallidilutea]GAL68105.1 hypothetical protein JCM19301_1202 [Jejuia pallidilutea]
MYLNRTITVVALMLFSTLAFSQMETSNWYFGQNSGLNFKDTQVTVLNNGAMVTPAGCTSISDRMVSCFFILMDKPFGIKTTK